LEVVSAEVADRGSLFQGTGICHLLVLGHAEKIKGSLNNAKKNG
jgi:hypothetical protein